MAGGAGGGGGGRGGGRPRQVQETHTHLTDEQFDADRDQVLVRARDSGVELFVEIGEDEPQWPKARALAEKYIDVYWTAGFHPYYAIKADAGLVHRMEEALRHPRCVAVGEIGLDYHRDDSPRDVQQRVLEDLPDRGARQETHHSPLPRIRPWENRSPAGHVGRSEISALPGPGAPPAWPTVSKVPSKQLKR
ncbi:MAG: TatD family hydrolase [Elusimicrobia bacterium]|nr:TatD family hydrolase [Elusimicrobiota bacterium]